MDGPILLHERLDVAAALIAFVTARSAGSKKAKITDFIPKWDRRPPTDKDVVSTLAQMMEDASQPSQPSSSTSSETPPD